MSNFSKDIKDEVEDIKKKVKKIGNDKQSLAYEMLLDQRKQNKRLFIVIIVLCFMLTGLMCYTIWLLNDIEVVETTETNENYDYNQDIDDTGDINNSNIVNGGDING